MFQEFIKNHNIVMEGRGKSMGAGGWKMPVTDPMAYFVSIFPGNALRAQILCWFMTRGLVEASKNRDELAKIVNDTLMKSPSPKLAPKYNTGHSGTPAIGEVTEPMIYHDAPESGVHSHDLFSPRALERLSEQYPNITGKFLHGNLTIEEFYDMHYEPKQVYIQTAKGDFQIDIVKTNQMLEAKGLAPFKYGGIGGYLQYVEKGDYLPAKERRSFRDPNQQHGPDMSRASMGMHDKKGHPIAIFEGGAIGFQSYKFVQAVNEAQYRFNQVADAISNEEPISVESTPEQQETVANLLKFKDNLKKEEGKAKKYTSARSIFGLDSRTSNVDFKPDPMYIDLLKEATKLGLAQGFKVADLGTRGEKNFDPTKLLDELRTHRLIHDTEYDKKTTMVFLRPEAIEKILAHIFSGAPESVLCNWTWKTVLGLERGNANGRGRLSTIVEKGFKTDSSFYDEIKSSGYVPQDIDHTSVISKLDSEDVPFSDSALRSMKEPSEKENELLQKGYTWDLRNPVSKKETSTKRPDWMHPKRNSAELLYKIGDEVYDRIRVTGKDNKLYASIALSSGESYTKPFPTWRMPPGLMLGGGSGVTTGIDLGHIKTNPVQTKEEWSTLWQRLAAGEMGERQNGATEVTQLDSVIQGACQSIAKSLIDTAYRFYLPTKGSILGSTGLPNYSSYDGDEKGLQALQDSAAALWAFSGDRAFEIGWVTEDEIKWDQEQEMGKERWLQQQDDEELISKKKLTFGLGAMLLKNGLIQKDSEFQSISQEIAAIESDWWNTLKKWVEEGQSPNGFPFTEKTLNTIGENARLARIKYVSEYVGQKMKRELEKLPLEKSGGAAGNEEGGGVGVEDAKGAKKVQAIDDREIDHDPLTPSSKRDEFGVKDRFGISDDSDKTVKKVKKTQKSIAPPQTGTLASMMSPADEAPAPAPAPVAGSMASMMAPTPATAKRAAPKKAVSKNSMMGMMFSTPKQEHFIDFKLWKIKNEMVGTGVVYDGTKPKTGCGFNVWGKPGSTGTEIAGDANTSKEDPIGKGIKRGRRKKKK